MVAAKEWKCQRPRDRWGGERSLNLVNLVAWKIHEDMPIYWNSVLQKEHNTLIAFMVAVELLGHVGLFYSPTDYSPSGFPVHGVHPRQEY